MKTVTNCCPGPGHHNHEDHCSIFIHHSPFSSILILSKLRQFCQILNVKHSCSTLFLHVICSELSSVTDCVCEMIWSLNNQQVWKCKATYLQYLGSLSSFCCYMLDDSLDQINVWISKCGQCASANVSFYYESRSRVLIKYFLNIANKLKREETLYSGASAIMWSR